MTITLENKQGLIAGDGILPRIESILKEEEIKQLTFLGKVHKKVLLQLHKFDKRAVDLIKEAARLNDDQVMLMIVKELEKIGVEVLDQTIFIKSNDSSRRFRGS